MNEPVISQNMIVADVMSRWPATIWALNGLRMACPGCPMAPFMTLAEVAAAYRRNAQDLCNHLENAIAEARQ